ncbi:hypothetical protein ABIE58_001745 [Roseovarius sp. MBR-78]|jgi:hypothetical protein
MKVFKLNYQLVALAVSVLTTPAVAQDSDGCFATANKCVSITSKWKDGAFISYFTNNCSGRVYARYCNEREAGRHDCGATGIRQGKRHSWRTGSDATGRVNIYWVGSLHSSKDWVCSGKVEGWRDPMF